MNLKIEFGINTSLGLQRYEEEEVHSLPFRTDIHYLSVYDKNHLGFPVFSIQEPDPRMIAKTMDIVLAVNHPLKYFLYRFLGRGLSWNL